MLTTVLLIALASVSQQGGQVDCNNQARHQTTSAGNTSTGTTNCASFSFTITIAGQSFTFSSPASCDTGRREQDKDCFECGPASQGNHCKANGFKANVKIYSIGGGNPCPTIPEPLPSTLEAASAAVQCATLPQISSEDNWCASVRSCGESGTLLAEEADTLILGGGRGARDYWRGHEFDLDWEDLAPRSEFEARLRSLPRLSVETLPQPLRGTVEEAPVPVGVEVSGVLDIVYFQRGMPEIVNRFEFTALVLPNGMHVREREFVADEEGRLSPRVESLLHDGRTLLIESEDSPVGHAYLPGYYDLPAVVRARLGPYRVLETWFHDPASIQRLAGTTYETLNGPNGEVLVIEKYPGIQGPGADGATVYRLGGDEDAPRVQSIEYLNGAGAVRTRRTLANYTEIGAGTVRPSQIVETRHDPEGRIEVSRSLRLRAVSRATLEQARQRGWLIPHAQEWFVYQ